MEEVLEQTVDEDAKEVLHHWDMAVYRHWAKGLKHRGYGR
jgi:hypothetical protein